MSIGLARLADPPIPDCPAVLDSVGELVMGGFIREAICDFGDPVMISRPNAVPRFLGLVNEPGTEPSCLDAAGVYLD